MLSLRGNTNKSKAITNCNASINLPVSYYSNRVTTATQQADLTYAVVGGTQTEMKIDPNIAANPAYKAVKCDQEDHIYDVVSKGAASRQRRGN